MQKIIADQITQFLVDFGVDCVYLYPGGTIAPLVNSFIALGVKIEVFKHEQGAVYAALAKARLTGKLQVAMVTSGPGVTNAITPLADAFYDSTPLLLITGQIGTGDLLSGRKVRQRGFQEVPTLSIVSEISKLALCPNNVNDVMPNLHNLIHTALDRRKGPVVFDLDTFSKFKSLYFGSQRYSVYFKIHDAVQKTHDVIGSGCIAVWCFRGIQKIM